MFHDPDFADFPQRFLVTGGTGFIGSALCRALHRQGHEVTVLSRTPSKVSALFGNLVRSVQALSALPPASHFDVVVNLAGEPIFGPRWTPARKAVLQASRWDVTSALVDWIAQAQNKPRLMISASAIGYYGTQSEDLPDALSEDAPASEHYMSQICQTWESRAQAVQPSGVRLAILRLGVVLGPLRTGQGALPKMVLPVRLGLSGLLGHGRQTVSWVHLADVLGAVAHVMHLPEAQGPFNVTAPEPLSQRAFMQIAAQRMHRRWTLPVATPGWLLQGLLGEQSALLLQGQRVVPTRLKTTGYAFAYPTLDQALQDCLER